MPSDRPPPVWPFLLITAAASGWIVFGSLHVYQHSDALIHVLNSLHQWDPFFWEQDRYGALVPLLARPFRHPLANLLVQNAITVFGGLMTLVLVPRYLARDRRYPIVAALSIMAFLGLASPLYKFEFLVDTGYGAAFGLAYGALVLLIPDKPGDLPRPSRFLLAIPMMVLAHWVFFPAFLTLLPVVLFRSWADRSGRPGWLRGRIDPECITSVLVIGLGVAGALLLQTTANHQWVDPPDTGTLPLGRWLPVTLGMLRQMWLAHWPYRLWLGFLALAAILSVVLLIVRPESRIDWKRTSAAPIAAGLAAYLFLGTRRWVELNSSEYRYLMPSFLLVAPAVLAPTATMLVRRIPVLSSNRVAALISVGIFLSVFIGYGVPSLDRVRRDLRASLGPESQEVVDAGCTHVAGDYWFVWRTVYHASLLKAERGESGRIWGISLRGRATWHQWRDGPSENWRIAIRPYAIDEANHEGKRFELPPLEVVERRPTIWVCRVKAVQ